MILLFQLILFYYCKHNKEPEQEFKACANLTKLGEKYGSKKLELACSEVLSYTSAPSIRLISTILKSGFGSSKQSESEPATPRQDHNSNAYGITRGAAYYSKLRKDGESK